MTHRLCFSCHFLTYVDARKRNVQLECRAIFFRTEEVAKPYLVLNHVDFRHGSFLFLLVPSPQRLDLVHFRPHPVQVGLVLVARLLEELDFSVRLLQLDPHRLGVVPVLVHLLADALLGVLVLAHAGRETLNLQLKTCAVEVV